MQRSGASVRALARRHGISPTTVQKCCKRTHANDAWMEPNALYSTVLTTEEEAMIVAFRRHTLLPLDERLYALQVSIFPDALSASPLPAIQISNFCATHGNNRRL